MKQVMKPGLLVSLIAGAAALTGLFYTFVTQSSPYVTVAQAKSASGERLHMPGDIEKGSLIALPRDRQVKFTLRDEKGDTIRVTYYGPPPANMGNATKVVAIGAMKGDEFHAEKLLLKCPSKYNSETDFQGSARS